MWVHLQGALSALSGARRNLGAKRELHTIVAGNGREAGLCTRLEVALLLCGCCPEPHHLRSRVDVHLLVSADGRCLQTGMFETFPVRVCFCAWPMP